MTARRDILVVEDDPSIRAFVRDALNEAGYAVREAADGAAALEALYAEQPRALLLDLGLPIVDGTAVARASRTLYDGDVPIVVISARPDAELDAREVGASGLLPKPFLVEELESVLGRALAGRDSLTVGQREVADRRALERDTSRGGALRRQANTVRD